METMKKQIRENIQFLIDDNKLDEAMSLIGEYIKIDSKDIEIYSMKAVVFIMQGNLNEAEIVLKEGLTIDSEKFDLNYNLGYLYEQGENFNEAVRYYRKALDNCQDKVMIDNINNFIKEIMKKPNFYYKERGKLAIICLKGLDSFIHDIAEALSADYDVKKFIIENEKQVYEAVDWADIIWLEWANDSSIIATQYNGILNKKVIIRIHGYEVFTDLPSKINWEVVDKLIFVAEHKREVFFKMFGNVIEFEKTQIIRNGLNLNKYFIEKNKKKNKNIAFVGYINYRKGLETLIQFFYELVQIDPEYKLYIRGEYQDLRLKIYDEQIINELGISKNIIFVGRVDDLNKWFSNITYIVSSSIEESFHYTIGEGMLAGLKPVVHAWKESRDLWPNEYIYRNRKEFLDIILSDEYKPEKYRKFVSDKYALSNQINNIKELINDINKKIEQKQKELTLDFMVNSFNDFIPYTKLYMDKYNFQNYRILIGKKEKISEKYKIYECIIENSKGKKLVLTNIWYDNENNTMILPDCYKNTVNYKFINKIISEINNIKVNNDMGGFILDNKLKRDVEENYLAYNWERGIQGTQFMPSIRYLFIIERYKFIGKFINKKYKVLEAAPGFGYGAAYLSTLCKEIDALDIAKENIEFGESAYDFKNLNWVQGDVTKLPYDQNVFDVYVSCETMEHLPLNILTNYFNEAVRVIKKGGKMIITTPNRLTRQNVHNPYHIKEYTFIELKEILCLYFDSIEFYSVIGYKVKIGENPNADGLMAVCYKK